MAQRDSFGQCGIQLLRQVAFCSAETLPAYDDDGIRQVIDEITEHCTMIGELVDRARAADNLSPEEQPNMMLVHHRPIATMMLQHVEAVLRNKRLLLAYHNARLERIRELRWRGKNLPPEVEQKLSPAEHEFYKSYDKLLNQYMRRGTGIGLDIMTDLVPPKDPMILVLVKEELGEIFFNRMGFVRLRPNTQHWLPREDVEEFIRQGKLEPFDT